MRKATVDELVKRAGIPKGTFYLFYASKELLFYDVLCGMHDEIHGKLLAQVEAMDGSVGPEELTDLIFGLYRFAQGSFLLELLCGGELELILRRLPREVAAAHAQKDDFSVEQLRRLVPDLKPEKLREFSGALRGIFLSMLHRHEIREDVFEGALRLMIRGVVLQMYGEEKS